MESTHNTKYDLLFIGILLIGMFGIVIGLYVADLRTGVVASSSKWLYTVVMEL